MSTFGIQPAEHGGVGTPAEHVRLLYQAAVLLWSRAHFVTDSVGDPPTRELAHDVKRRIEPLIERLRPMVVLQDGERVEP